jgi:hypothetical protein
VIVIEPEVSDNLQILNRFPHRHEIYTFINSNLKRFTIVRRQTYLQ